MATVNSGTYNAQNVQPGLPSPELPGPRWMGGEVLAASAYFDGDAAASDTIAFFILPRNAIVKGVLFSSVHTSTGGLTIKVGTADDDDRYFSGSLAAADRNWAYGVPDNKVIGGDGKVIGTFNNVNPPADGEYHLTVLYVLGSDDDG